MGEATSDVPRGIWTDQVPLRPVAVDELDRAERPLTEEEWRERLRQEELRARQLLACQEAERQRLSRQLHDEVGQMLAAICMRLHAAEDGGGQETRAALDECLSIAEQAIHQVRELSQDLCPPLLDDFGLQPALVGYVEQLAERAGLSVSLVTSSSLGPLPNELQMACFRVVQEALGNVIRHASARQVRVELRRDAEAVELTIRDDGVGFDPQAVERSAKRSTQFGMTAMRQRAELLGGSCCIASAPGQGTTLQVRWPLEGWLGDEGTFGPAAPETGDKSGWDPDAAGIGRCFGPSLGRQP